MGALGLCKETHTRMLAAKRKPHYSLFTTGGMSDSVMDSLSTGQDHGDLGSNPYSVIKCTGLT